MRHYTDITIWKDVTQAEWDSWEWQVRNRITTLDKLKQVVHLTAKEEEGVVKSLEIDRKSVV